MSDRRGSASALTGSMTTLQSFELGGPRGVGTFLSIADYPFDDWRRRRSRRA